MIVSLPATLGERLQGRLNGRRDFARLCEVLSGASKGDIVFLDFTGVKVVTGSWANEALVSLLRWATDERNDLFPVLLGLDALSAEEVAFVAEATHTHFLAVDRHPPRRAALIGRLDPGQRATLDAVVGLGEATGAVLAREKPGGLAVEPTAWNNRLKDLHGKRLLRRSKRGREQVYSPVVPEVVADG